MRPLRKGAARGGLAQGLLDLGLSTQTTPDEPFKLADLDRVVQLQAAVLGGAIKQACQDMAIEEEVFFRYMNENLWRLTRSLKASNLLDKVE